MPENGVLRKDFPAIDDLRTGNTAGVLKQDERQYRRIIENAPVGIVQTTTEGRIITANPALARILGYGSVDELMRTAPSMVSHYADVADRSELIPQLQQHGAVVDFEIQMRRKDRNLIWVSVDIQVVRDEHGVQRFQGAVEDVTERKRAEVVVWEAASRAWRRRRITVAAELAILGGLTILFFGFAARFDWFEVVTGWFRVSRTLQQLDDLVLAAVFLFVGLLVFALRRWHESESEVTSQRRVEEAIRLLHAELDVRVKQRTAELREANDALRAEAVERTRAAAALREEHEFNRQIIHGAHEGIVVYGPDLRYQVWNPYMERLTGLPAAEVLGRHPLEVFPFFREAGIMAMLENALAGKSPRHRDFQFQVPQTGRSGWISDWTAPLRNADGVIIGVVSIVRDITERWRAEAALRESEERFRRLSEAAFEAIALHEGGVVVSANDQYFEMFGYEPDELLGKQVMLLTVVPEAREFMRQQIATGGLGPYESIGLRKDGTKFPMEIRVREMEYQGRKIRVGAIMDFTERKRAEEELRTSREQMRALAVHLQTVREEERTRVAREIHDVLAQELTRLKIDLVWLQRRLAEPGQAAATERLTARVAEMSQMADTAIHTVQRIATELRPAVLDSLGLCAAVEWQARDFQAHVGIQCHVSVPEEELPVDRDAATAAFRILQESLTNVQRHAHATRVEVSLRQEAGQLILRVEDNGRGIQPERLNSPLSIGLTGMRERALLLGGQLEIRSQLGSGTTIEARLLVTPNGNPPEPTP